LCCDAPAAGASAGKALPIAFLLAFIAAFFVGNTVIEFAKRLPSAGSFYTFCSRSLGSRAGFFTGWLYFAAFMLLTVGLFTAHGAFLHSYLKETNLVPHGVLAWVILGFVVYGYLQKSGPEKLAALGATMATDEMDFAEAKDVSLSTGQPKRDAEPDSL
jgi:amino acid transporter